jgi:hypothetical protein
VLGANQSLKHESRARVSQPRQLAGRSDWIASTRLAVPADYTPLPVAAAETWLLTTGWRRHPPISWLEAPAERTG